MSDADLTDLCRQIAAEHAERLAGAHARVPHETDPLALIGRIGDYAQGLRDLSDEVEAKEESAR